MTTNDEPKSTPGPWRWELNEKSKIVQLQGGIPKFDCTVMDFVRYGMGGAAPRFVTEFRPNMNILKRCEEYGSIVPGREHHADWHKTLDHPDARLIAAAPDYDKAARDMCEVLSRFGQWDDGCFYFFGRSAPELEGPFRALSAAIAKATGAQS